MRYYMIALIMWVGAAQAWAQQPRLKQVDDYLAVTGQPVELKSAPQKQYNLLGSLYKENKTLMLNLPELEDFGAREVMPFGYRLTPASEVELAAHTGNRAETTVRPLYNRSIFSGVSYQLCDSAVYGITLYFDGQDAGKAAAIRRHLKKYFRKADYEHAGLSVYSDPDYAVKLLPGKAEFYSLFHYPVTETFYPGVSTKIWTGPCSYEADGSALTLAFFNQESKENNIQSAISVDYRYPAGKSFKMNRIRFILDDETIELPLEIEYTDTTDSGKMCRERDTRTFLFPEALKAIVRSAAVRVELVGEGGSFIYPMPAFQRASAHTAYEYFRWNVTNPMAKYRGW